MGVCAVGRLQLPCGFRRGSRTASRLGFLPITALRLSEVSTLRAAPHTSDRHGYRKESAFENLPQVAASSSRQRARP